MEWEWREKINGENTISENKDKIECGSEEIKQLEFEM